MDSSSSSSPSLSSQRRRLPNTPGVYIFTNASGTVIYVGKANNLKQRVSSYFQPPIRLGPKTSLLVKNITSLDFIQVSSEIEALLLESRLIKKFKPRFNLISKDDKSPYYVHLTQETFPKPLINHDPRGSLAGPFLNRLVPHRIINHFRHISPFCTAKRPVKSPCFYSHLGLCSPCPGSHPDKSSQIIYRKNISRLKKLFKGQFVAVINELNRSMNQSAKIRDYETASVIRDQIASLKHLSVTPILPEQYLQNPNLSVDLQQQMLDALTATLSQSGINVTSLNRIEMYDNAHLSGTAATGSMVVAVNGALKTNEYRHFKIKSSRSGDDIDMMREILQRRLSRADWSFPDLIILDGGIPQLSCLTRLPASLKVPPVIALAKQYETLIIPLSTGDYRQINLSKDHPGLRLIQSLRDEAHRFSRRLHHQLRSRMLLSSSP